jgi:hypothetical protein
MDAKHERAGHGVLICLFGLLVIYVFFPFAIALPLMALEEGGKVPFIRNAEIIFRPLEKLQDHCPPYRALLDVERKALRKMLGQDP